MGRYGFPRDNRTLVKAVVGLFILEAVMQTIVVALSAIEYRALGTPEGVDHFHSEDLSSLDLAMMGLGLLYIFSLVVLIVFYCIWKNRSCKNAWMLTPQVMTTTPGWAVGWYFVPIMNLFKPYVAMREIRDASCPPGRLTAALPAWWTLWIITNIAENISMRLALDVGNVEQYKASAVLDMALLPVNLVLTVIIIHVVRTITAEQMPRLQQLTATDVAPPPTPGSQAPTG